MLSRLAAALAAHVATCRAHFACAPSVTWRALEEPLKLRLAVGVTYSFTGVAACVAGPGRGLLPGRLATRTRARATLDCARSRAGEDAGRYVLARHGILGVVRRELAAAGVRYTAPVLAQPPAAPPAIITAGA